jgi:hypothetical protein
VTSNSSLRKRNKEHKIGNFDRLRVSFSRRAELRAREYGGHLEYFLYESKDNGVINSVFVFFMYTASYTSEILKL